MIVLTAQQPRERLTLTTGSVLKVETSGDHSFIFSFLPQHSQTANLDTLYPKPISFQVSTEDPVDPSPCLGLCNTEVATPSLMAFMDKAGILEPTYSIFKDLWS